jgi:hypothetical protein
MHIEELVLRGFDPADRRRVAKAVREELARLLAEGGVPPPLAQGGEATWLDAGSFDAVPGSGADEIGAQVARAIYGAPAP